MIEKIDCLNEFGEYTNKILSREECHKEGIFRKAVVLLLLTVIIKY